MTINLVFAVNAQLLTLLMVKNKLHPSGKSLGFRSYFVRVSPLKTPVWEANDMIAVKKKRLISAIDILKIVAAICLWHGRI